MESFRISVAIGVLGGVYSGATVISDRRADTVGSRPGRVRKAKTPVDENWKKF